ncbi:MAG: hypothetical protein QW569_00930 [Candidatus Bathyarchaeia archaeon]|nr:hypothetical protein [Candidatus Bathyarchaeota archaeon]
MREVDHTRVVDWMGAAGRLLLEAALRLHPSWRVPESERDRLEAPPIP